MQPKFTYKQRVYINKGFYQGQYGEVWAYRGWFLRQYRVYIEGTDKVIALPERALMSVV
jgi:hypothetical protein